MNDGNPSHVGRRRRRPGPPGAQPGNHRAGSPSGPAYNGRRRKEATHAYSVFLPDNHLFDRFREMRFGRLHLAVAAAVSLVVAVGAAIVLGNLPGDDDGGGGAGTANAALLYSDGQALPDGFADANPALAERIYGELEARYGLAADDLYDPDARPEGPRVVLTLDRDLQEAAEATAGEAGVVAVEPGTGAVLCYFGAEATAGADLVGAGSPHPPTAAFDMITAATALESGASIGSWWKDGDSDVTLAQAVQEGRGAAMDAVAAEFGVEAVLGTAAEMGLTAVTDADGTARDVASGDVEGLNAADLGTYGVSVVDMATVYATIASGGVRADTHLVGSVVDAQDRAIEPGQGIRTDQALAETTAQDLQFLGLGESEAIEDREFFAVAADFHGTTTQSWFVGAIPQLSVAAWANGSAAADGGITLWRSVIGTAIEVNGYEAQDLPGASGAGEELTDGIADADGNIDPDSPYCEANPDEPACGAAESPTETESPTPEETTEEPEPDPDPTTEEPGPDPTTEDPPEDPPTSEDDCGWPWC